MQLTDRVALVTGGAHRVGKAITLELARAGAHVVVNYHSSGQEAEKTAEQARALGVEALTVQCDVADRWAVEAMQKAVADRFGRLDILVNGASYFGRTPLPVTSEEGYREWHRVMDILVDGSFYVSNLLIPLLQAGKSPTIVNILDLSIRQPWPGFGAHAMGKSALLALTRQLALELAPTVRVNAVAPGPVLPPPGYDGEKLAAAANRTLLKRWGSAQDVADAVCFLCRAEYITGEVIYVDGGERLAHAAE